MRYLNSLVGTGAVLTLTEYKDLAALNRDDIVLWREAEAQRMADDQKLNEMGAARE